MKSPAAFIAWLCLKNAPSQRLRPKNRPQIPPRSQIKRGSVTYPLFVFRRLEGRTLTSEELSRYGRPLIGHQLMAVEKKDYSWFFTFAREMSIATESPWRLFDKGCMVVTSEDHGHPFGLPSPVDAAALVLSRTDGRAVEAASIFARSGDLAIEFGGGVQLQFLQLSAGYESWRLSVQGQLTICTGGGDIAHFS